MPKSRPQSNLSAITVSRQMCCPFSRFASSREFNCFTAATSQAYSTLNTSSAGKLIRVKRAASESITPLACWWKRVGKSQNRSCSALNPPPPSAMPPLRRITICLPEPIASTTTAHSLKAICTASICGESKNRWPKVESAKLAFQPIFYYRNDTTHLAQ